MLLLECTTTVSGAPSCSPSPTGRIRKSCCPSSTSLAHVKANLFCCSSQRVTFLRCVGMQLANKLTLHSHRGMKRFLSCKGNVLAVVFAWWRWFTCFLLIPNNHHRVPVLASQDSEGCKWVIASRASRTWHVSCGWIQHKFTITQD